MIFNKRYSKVFIIKSKTLGNKAKTYVCLSDNQIDFYSFILVSDNIIPYFKSGFVILKKFRNKYLTCKYFGLQNMTFKEILLILQENNVLNIKKT